jgi:hypothetical protein
MDPVWKDRRGTAAMAFSFSKKNPCYLPQRIIGELR